MNHKMNFRTYSDTEHSYVPSLQLKPSKIIHLYYVFFVFTEKSKAHAAAPGF